MYYDKPEECSDLFIFDASEMDVKRLTGLGFFEDQFRFGWSGDNWYRLDFHVYGRKKTAIGTEYSDCQQAKS